MEQYFRVHWNSGFDASIDHVLEILKRAGYEEESGAKRGARLIYRVETRPLNHPAWDPMDASLTVVGRHAPLLRWTTNRNMLAINSYSTPPGGVDADLVFAGKGSAAELDSARVSGRVVLIEGPVGRVFSEAVTRRGAMGVLGYSLPAYTQAEGGGGSIRIPFQFHEYRVGLGPQELGDAAFTRRVRFAARGVGCGPCAGTCGDEDASFPIGRAHARGGGGGAHGTGGAVCVQRARAGAGCQRRATTGVGTQAEMARAIAVLLGRGQVDPRRTITMIWGNEIEQTRNFLARTIPSERAGCVGG